MQLTLNILFRSGSSQMQRLIRSSEWNGQGVFSVTRATGHSAHLVRFFQTYLIHSQILCRAEDSPFPYRNLLGTLKARLCLNFENFWNLETAVKGRLHKILLLLTEICSEPWRRSKAWISKISGTMKPQLQGSLHKILFSRTEICSESWMHGYACILKISGTIKPHLRAG